MLLTKCISLVVIVAVLVVLAVIFLVLYRRNRNKKTKQRNRKAESMDLNGPHNRRVQCLVNQDKSAAQKVIELREVEERVEVDKPENKPEDDEVVYVSTWL